MRELYTLNSVPDTCHPASLKPAVKQLVSQFRSGYLQKRSLWAYHVTTLNSVPDTCYQGENITLYNIISQFRSGYLPDYWTEDLVRTAISQFRSGYLR